MRRVLFGAITSVALSSFAEAETINLICGSTGISIDTNAKVVQLQNLAQVDPATKEFYPARVFKDGYKPNNGKKVQYVIVTDDAIKYGGEDELSSFRIDRYTGLLSSSLGAQPCSVAPSKRMF